MISTRDAQEAFNRSIVKFIQRQKRKLAAHNDSSSFFTLECHVLYLTAHATRVLEQLDAKRQSLEFAIEAWGGCSKSCIEVIHSISSNIKYNHDRNEITNILRETLQHWFTQYLRLRDGFVLLTNGECRHYNDSIEARNAKKDGYCTQKITRLLRGVKDHELGSYLSLISKIQSSFSFPSELDVDPANTRKDGYTKLFKSKNGYSGFGWDELFNDEVGIRYRLLTLLYQMKTFPIEIEHIATVKIKSELDRIWEEDLIEKGGAHSFDTSFDEHERKMQNLKKIFEERCDSFIGKVNSILRTNHFFQENQSSKNPNVKNNKVQLGELLMSKDDKFERLELKAAHTLGLSELTIQRQGDNFKVTDEHGVLPSNMNVTRWSSTMKLPKSLLSTSSIKDDHSKLKKVRRIIDEDNEFVFRANMNKDSSSLKVVIVENPKSSERPNNFDESIADIKRQCGVDSAGLERSLEAFEAEENDLHGKRLESMKPLASNHSITNNILQTKDVIMHERERLEMLKRVLERVKDLDEIWDVQESLRESFMFLGNALLSLHDLLQGKGDRSILFEAASCFNGSLTILKRLRKIVDSCFHDNTKDHIDFVKRTLIICRGRALTNLGRTFFEQFKERSYNVSKLVNDAISYLNEAISCAHALRAQSLCSLEFKDDQYTIFLEIHKYEADELELLAVRWLGICNWHIEPKGRALDILFKSISDRNKPTLSNMYHAQVLYAGMRRLLEEYYGLSFIINCATKEVYDAFLSKDQCEHYNDLATISLHCYERAMAVSDSLYGVAQSRADCPMKLNDLIQDHDIASSRDLEEMRDAFLEMWERKKSVVRSKTILQYDKRNEVLPRNDIFHGGFMPSNKNAFFQPGKQIPSIKDMPKEKTRAMISANTTDEQTDNAFDGFGLERKEDMPIGVISKTYNDAITYRLWGDEVLIAMGKEIDKYPSCCPKRPSSPS